MQKTTSEKQSTNLTNLNEKDKNLDIGYLLSEKKQSSLEAPNRTRSAMSQDQSPRH